MQNAFVLYQNSAQFYNVHRSPTATTSPSGEFDGDASPTPKSQRGRVLGRAHAAFSSLSSPRSRRDRTDSGGSRFSSLISPRKRRASIAESVLMGGSEEKENDSLDTTGSAAGSATRDGAGSGFRSRVLPLRRLSVASVSTFGSWILDHERDRDGAWSGSTTPTIRRSTSSASQDGRTSDQHTATASPPIPPPKDRRKEGERYKCGEDDSVAGFRTPTARRGPSLGSHTSAWRESMPARPSPPMPPPRGDPISPSRDGPATAVAPPRFLAPSRSLASSAATLRPATAIASFPQSVSPSSPIRSPLRATIHSDTASDTASATTCVTFSQEPTRHLPLLARSHSAPSVLHSNAANAANTPAITNALTQSADQTPTLSPGQIPSQPSPDSSVLVPAQHDQDKNSPRRANSPTPSRDSCPRARGYVQAMRRVFEGGRTGG